MIFKLEQVKTVESISKEDFMREHLLPGVPLVIKGISKQWAARTRWNYDYFKSKAGSITVPLYNNTQSGPTTVVNSADEHMPFGDYLDLIASKPTQLRMFLFNIFKHVPELCDDFTYPDHLMDGFLKQFPMMFFGGSGSLVHLHYDMDLSNILLTQFNGSKKVLLFPQSESAKLYRMPFMVQSFIDIRNPDLTRHPRLKDVEGLECDLHHGDTLFMPSGYWHYMEYTEGGFALALRAPHQSLAGKAKGIYNLLVMRTIDDQMKKLLGPKWYHYKERMAEKKAERA
jgi:hypothetical protein